MMPQAMQQQRRAVGVSLRTPQELQVTGCHMHLSSPSPRTWSTPALRSFQLELLIMPSREGVMLPLMSVRGSRSSGSSSAGPPSSSSGSSAAAATAPPLAAAAFLLLLRTVRVGTTCETESNRRQAVGRWPLSHGARPALPA